jgi:hypothetical protein
MHLQSLGESIQAPVHPFHCCHHELVDIVRRKDMESFFTYLEVEDAGEVRVQQLEERRLICGEVVTGEGFEEVAKVIATMKGDPLDIIREDQAGHHHQFSKAMRINAKVLKLLKVDP